MAPKDLHDTLDQWHDGLIALSELLTVLLLELGTIEKEPFGERGQYRKRHN